MCLFSVFFDFNKLEQDLYYFSSFQMPNPVPRALGSLANQPESRRNESYQLISCLYSFYIDPMDFQNLFVPGVAQEPSFLLTGKEITLM